MEWNDKVQHLTDKEKVDLEKEHRLCHNCNDGELVWCPIGVDLNNYIASSEESKIEIHIQCNECVFSRMLTYEESNKNHLEYYKYKFRRYRPFGGETRFKEFKERIENIHKYPKLILQNETEWSKENNEELQTKE